MAVLILLELLTLQFAMNNLSAVRAFVGGEGSWSKAQKNAAFHLHRYAFTQNEADYRAFKESLDLPKGDRLARLELLKPNPDLAVVRSGFLQGKIHPDDVTPMVDLITRFHWVSYIREAIEAWTEGDRLMIEFEKVGDDLHKNIISGAQDESYQYQLLIKVQRLNARLTQIEDNFSAVLGEGSRWLERVVFLFLFLVVLTVESVGLTLTFATSREISQNLLALNQFAEKLGQGRFGARLPVKGQNEFGKLTKSINQMAELLQEIYTELERKVDERTADLAEIVDKNAILLHEAQNAVMMRDEFLSIASHELRTPLTALVLQLQMMARKIKPQMSEAELESLRDQVLSAISHSRKLTALQGSLMDLTKVSMGKIDIIPKQCALTDVIQDTVSELNPEAKKAGSSISIITSKRIEGSFDPVRVGQVVTNLVSNAIKYGDGKPISVEVSQINKNAVVKVHDLGPGIAPDQQERIFGRYERATDDRMVSGLGLGLYISKQIVEAHGGELSLNSQVGRGTTFTATFPELQV